jgi:hypothetical protein
MATIDLSRNATNFVKHFESTRMQQGRVLTDDDFNEHAQLNGEDMRKTRVHVIGPAGSPDDGFSIDSLQVLPPTVAFPNGLLTFVIKAGTLYLGGLRLTLEQDEYYHLQKDWLQQGEDPVDRLAVPAVQRSDLVYLEAWQQPVSAVEDSELFEVALGSRDTSARIRTMRRVRVRQGVTLTDCEDAFQTLLTDLATQGTFIDDDAELVSDSRLKVEPDGTAGTPDLCSPPVAGGYLGAENQAIRVQLVSGTEFTWGFDNAAPLYRVQLANDDTGVPRRIVMLTEPADQAHWPLSGQVVELLPWSAALVNNQKLAEMHGHLAKVNGSYNPNNKTFFIDTAPPPPAGSPPHPFGEHWKERNDPGIGDSTILDDEGEFFYLRVWNRGSDAASPARIGFVPGTAVSLAHTGLKVTFTGTQFRRDDFWIIAARPDSPTVLVPWDFDPTRPPYGLLPYDGRPPHGVRRWLTPLCVIQWTPGAPPTGVVLHDCREHFPPLTRIRTCCTFIVGNGVTSHGHFDSIQTAVEHLPAEGGKICLLPGVYHENVRIVNRRNITICGCGHRSIVRSRGPTPPAAAAMPVISIIGGFNITLECFAVEADPTGLGILIRGKNTFSKQKQEALTEVVGVLLSELSVTAAQQTAVRARFVRDFTVRCCTLANLDQTSSGQTLVVLGDDVLIERNVVEVAAMRNPRLPPPDPAEPPAVFIPGTRARGGIQIEGLSDRVRIINNLIHGGSRNGITLGSIAILGPNDPDGPQDDPNDGDLPPVDPCDPCDPIDDIPDDPPGDGVRIVDGGPLSEIRIERNRIYDIGACGIGVVRFFDLRGQDEFISVYQLTILGNHIRHCLLREIRGPKPEVATFVGYGGISLADVHHLVVYDNVIEDCGLSLREPVCGIFVLQAEGSDLSRNRIFENGVPGLNIQRDTVANTNLTLGYRGGIVIAFALAPMGGLSPETIAPASFVAAQIKLPPTPTGEPAAKIHDNIVTVPVGRALHLNALGPVSVEGNHFTSRGVVQGFSAILGSQLAATVWILNLGFSNEFYLGYFFFAAGSNKAPLPGLDQFAIGRSLATGQVLFNDNQVTFDAFDPGVSFALSSVLIATADDLGFQDNHCESNLFNDFVVTQSLLLGVSSRTNSNRFTEGKLNAFFSAVTVGFIANTTTINQATHCILSRCILNPLGLKYALNFETVGVNPNLGGDLLCARIQTSFGGRDQTIDPHP